MGFQSAIAPLTLKDPFVARTANLRDALIKYMK
jgi:hypothetical protein